MKKIIVSNLMFDVDDNIYLYIRNYIDRKGYSNFVYDDSDGFRMQSLSAQISYQVIAIIVVSYTDALIDKYNNTLEGVIFKKYLSRLADLAKKAYKFNTEKKFMEAINIMENILYRIVDFTKRYPERGIK